MCLGAAYWASIPTIIYAASQADVIRIRGSGIALDPVARDAVCPCITFRQSRLRDEALREFEIYYRGNQAPI
jgi:tRNA(Arg) A34 adenosine deaminase TadA